MGRTLSRPDAPRRTCRIGVVAALLVAPLGWQFSAAAGVEPVSVTAMERFLARRAAAHQYAASRRLEASGKGRRAWLDARTHFTRASGLSYEVTAEGGSGFIRARVLRSLLDEEKQLIARGGEAGVALSPANYEFSPEGVNEEGLAVVGLRPLRKDRSLIAGRMLLSATDGELLRVEGRLAKNPSFWVTRVNVVRSYRRINGVLMPVSLDTKAQLRLIGSSTLRMTYRYSQVDGRPVGEGGEHQPGDRSVLPFRSLPLPGGSN